MSLLNFARVEVMTASPGMTVAEAARQMDEKQVGCLVVVQEQKPIGILTDRDIVMRVVAQGGDAKATVVETVMTPNPYTLEEELGLFEALEIMKSHGVRRFPVIDRESNLSGFFTVDDVLYLLGLEMSAVARIIDQESP